MLDAASTLNKRTLSYVKDNLQPLLLTPEIFEFGEETRTIEEDLYICEGDARQRAKYIQSCRKAACGKWRNEYLKSFGEKHNMK